MRQFPRRKIIEQLIQQLIADMFTRPLFSQFNVIIKFLLLFQMTFSPMAQAAVEPHEQQPPSDIVAPQVQALAHSLAGYPVNPALDDMTARFIQETTRKIQELSDDKLMDLFESNTSEESVPGDPIDRGQNPTDIAIAETNRQIHQLNSLQNRNWADGLEQTNIDNGEDRSLPSQMNHEQVQKSHRVLAAVTMMKHVQRAQIRALGVEEFVRRVEADSMSTTLDNGTVVELTKTDDLIFTKVRFPGDNKNYFWIDDPAKLDTDAYKKYLARVHIDGGREKFEVDTDNQPVVQNQFWVMYKLVTVFKKLTGRDVVIVLAPENRITGWLESPKPKMRQAQWWQEKWRAVKSDKQPWTFALANGAAQASAGFVLTSAMEQLSGKDLHLWLSTAFTMVFSTVLARNIGVYRRLTVESGSVVSQWVVMAGVGLIYALGIRTLVAADSGHDIQTLAVLLMNATSGIIANSAAKQYWNRITAVMTTARTHGSRFWFTNWDTKNVAHQTLYLLSWSLNYLNILFYTQTQNLVLPGTDISVPVFQLVGAFGAAIAATVYAERKLKKLENDPLSVSKARKLRALAEKYQREWDVILKYSGVTVSARTIKQIAGRFRGGLGSPENSNLQNNFDSQPDANLIGYEIDHEGQNSANETNGRNLSQRSQDSCTSLLERARRVFRPRR